MLRLFTLMLGILGVAGCQAPPPANFSVANVGPGRAKLDAELRSVTVTVANPGEAVGNLSWVTGATTTLWQTSLQDALNRMAVFRDDSPRKVSLVVKILQFDIPDRAATFKTSATARYELLDRSTGAALYTTDINANSAVSMDYALLGRARAIESINRAVQGNIAQFLQAIETTNINGVTIATAAPAPPPQAPVASVAPPGVVVPSSLPAAGARTDQPTTGGVAGAIGTEYHGTLAIGSIQVPLLAGTWQLAGQGGPSADDAASLVRIENGKLWGILRVWTAKRPAANGYPSFASCNRQDVAFLAVAANVDHGTQDCWAVNHYDMENARATSTQRHMLDSYAFLDARGIGVPRTMIVGIHRIATTTNFVTIWYQVNPELAGFAAPPTAEWRASDWHRDRIALDPKRTAYIETFKQEHAQYQELLRRGFQHALVSLATPRTP
jgi:hypothetical protein